MNKTERGTWQNNFNFVASLVARDQDSKGEKRSKFTKAPNIGVEFGGVRYFADQPARKRPRFVF